MGVPATVRGRLMPFKPMPTVAITFQSSGTGPRTLRPTMRPWVSAAARRSGSPTQRSRPGRLSPGPREVATRALPAPAIATALTLRAIFRVALRQTEGLIGSIIALLGLDLVVPDHTTFCRRAESLGVVWPQPGSGPVHLLVDSTGFKLRGSGRRGAVAINGIEISQ